MGADPSGMMGSKFIFVGSPPCGNLDEIKVDAHNGQNAR